MRKIVISWLLSIIFAWPAMAGSMDAHQAYSLTFPSSMFNGDILDKISSRNDFYSFYTGGYFIYPKDMDPQKNSNHSFTLGEVYDVTTGKLVNTFNVKSLQEYIDPDDPDSVWINTNDIFSSYGKRVMFFFKDLVDAGDGDYVDQGDTGNGYIVFDVTNGNVLWINKDLKNNLEDFSYFYDYKGIIDNEKIILLNFDTCTSVSVYYFKNGSYEQTPSINICLDEDIKLSGVYDGIIDASKNYVAIYYSIKEVLYIININDKSIQNVDVSGIFDEDVVQNADDGSSGLYFYKFGYKRNFLTDDGHLIALEQDSPDSTSISSQWRERNIVKYNPFTGDKTVLHSYTPASGYGSGIGDYITYDSATGHIYFLENIGEETTLSRIWRECPPNLVTTQETVYTAQGTPFLYQSELVTSSADKAPFGLYNLFRITDSGSKPVALSNDFSFKSLTNGYMVAKNGNLLLRSFADQFAEGDYSPGDDCESSCPCITGMISTSSCECSSLTRTYTNSDEPYEFAVVADAPTASSYAPLIIVEPVVPAKANDGSTTREGAKYIRTYKLKAADGSTLEGAVVTSVTGISSTSDAKGIVAVRNTAEDDAGTYLGKTIHDVMATVSYEGKIHAFYFRPKYGEEQTFDLVIEPGGVYEKRYDLELGGSLSAGVGAFRFGTIKAASIDLEASAASGIYFDIIDDQGTRSMEMGRNLSAGLGANAVLAEAELKGGFSAGAGVGLDVMAVGAQSFSVADPFDDANTTARSVTTAFIWDTLVKNGSLAFPSVGLVINWIWDNIKSSDLNDSKILESAGLQVGGEASAGIDIPALEIASGGTELAGSNLSNLGLSLPSVSGGFVVEGLLHQFSSSGTDEQVGVEVSMTTEMQIDAGIFDGVYDYTGLPELPAGHKSTYGLLASFDASNAPHTFYLSYMTEQESGDQIEVSETELALDAAQLVDNLALLPASLQNISQRKNVGALSWDTKGLQSLYKQTIHAAGKGVSGTFTTFTDMVADTTYEFEIGLGLGLNFGVGAHLSYLEHERSKQKAYKIDEISEGMGLVEDWTGLTPKFPSETFGDILGITLEYLKDCATQVYTTVIETIQSGVDTIVTSGNAVLTYVGGTTKSAVTLAGSTADPYQVALTTFVPLSSDAGSAVTKMSTSVPKATLAALGAFAALNTASASVGEAALVNVMDQSDGLIDAFPAATLALTYSDDDLTAAGLSTASESDLFMWQFRPSDKKHARLDGYTLDTANNAAVYTGVATNGVFGVGFDNVAPEAEYKFPGNNSSINADKGIFWKLSDDFSGIDFDSILITLDGSTLVDGSNLDDCFNASNGYLLVDTTFDAGSHVLTISMKDTAGNYFNDSVAFTAGVQDSDDYDQDGIPNYQDKFPTDVDYWQDDDNDGIPDSQDTDISDTGDLACSCGSIHANPTEPVDFKDCFGTFDGFVMTLHNIAISTNGDYDYFWIETVFDDDTASFVFTGNWGQQTDLSGVTCNCGLRTHADSGALSLENAYTEFNYGDRLTLHDVAIQNGGGDYGYYWLNFSIDLSTATFSLMDEYGLEIQ